MKNEETEDETIGRRGSGGDICTPLAVAQQEEDKQLAKALKIWVICMVINIAISVMAIILVVVFMK